jgi:EPS-associated MarR family transcriptional regulator
MPEPVDEIRYRLLSHLSEHPDATQRQLAARLGMSLGKTNYCLHALIERGFVKAGNFRRSKNKSAYSYVLTPRGIGEKLALTQAFLIRKMAEYESIEHEIERLRTELQQSLNVQVL